MFVPKIRAARSKGRAELGEMSKSNDPLSLRILELDPIQETPPNF